jgi:hypothetical protein
MLGGRRNDPARRETIGKLKPRPRRRIARTPDRAAPDSARESIAIAIVRRERIAWRQNLSRLAALSREADARLRNRVLTSPDGAFHKLAYGQQRLWRSRLRWREAACSARQTGRRVPREAHYHEVLERLPPISRSDHQHDMDVVFASAAPSSWCGELLVRAR